MAQNRRKCNRIILSDCKARRVVVIVVGNDILCMSPLERLEGMF